MKPLIIVVATLVVLLANGCATTGSESTHVRTREATFTAVEVQTAVRERCVVDIPAEPEYALDQFDPEGKTTHEKVKKALVELEQRIDYIRLMLAAAIKCE